MEVSGQLIGAFAPMVSMDGRLCVSKAM